MKLDAWRNGLNIAINNVLQLYNDGKLLMENGSYGHACFSFITAFEEMGIAYLILGNFNDPKPKKLEEYLNHAKKMAISNIISLLYTSKPAGNIGKFYEAVIKDKKKDTKISQKGKSELFKVAQDITEQENLWYLRIHGIYVTLNNAKTDFLSPTHIGKEHAEKLKEKLEDILPHLQVERDIYMKFGVPDKIEMDVIENLFTILTKFDEFFGAFEDGSLEKLNKLQNLSPILKDFSIDILLDKFPIKHEELNLEIDSLSSVEDFLNWIIIFTYEIVKSFKEQFKSIIKAGKPYETLQYRLEQLKNYSPPGENAIRVFVLSLLFSMLEDDFNIEDVIQLFKSKLLKSE